MTSSSIINQFTGEFDFLSNFYPCEIVHEDIKYPSTEHYYQALKTLNVAERKWIAKLPFPGQAKKEGGRLKLRADWEGIKNSVMLEGLQKKFVKGSALAEKLLATGDKTLVEGNWHRDTWWGVDLKTGAGKNHLGKLLMKVREALQSESSC